MDEIELLKRRIEREKIARKTAEDILEVKSLELYKLNQKLKMFNTELESTIQTQSEQLEESELKYKTLIDGIDDTIYNINNEGYFTYFNANATKLTEYSAHELSKMHFVHLVAKHKRAEIIEYHLNFINSDKYKAYFEFQLITKSGKVKWIGQSLTRIITENDVYFTAVARDISDQKSNEDKIIEAQNELENSEHKYRSIIENMELGLLEVDTTGKAIKVYPRFCKMIGYQEEELLGKKPENLFLDEKNKKLFYEHHSQREEGKSSVYEIELIRKDGKKINVLLSGAPFYDKNNNYKGSIGIHYEITEWKKLENELKKSKEIAERAQEAQKQFLANMSHEMRTPLNAIIGMSHLLEETSLDKEQMDLLKMLKSSGTLLLSLISDILDMSKIEAGIIEVQPKPFAIRKLITDIQNTFVHNIKGKNIELNIDISDDICEHLIGDDVLLSQVLINLVNNACKFTKQGFVNIDLELESNKDDNQFIKFMISDSGIGIDNNKLVQIFDEFAQADESIKHNFGGTGLGLAISKKLIKVLGSDIHVESTKGVGSTFYFTLNFDKNLDVVSQNLEKITNETGKLNLKSKVLIVEDNLMNINYISRLMNKWQLCFDIAHNGEEAIDLCRIVQYDIILMDLQMPVLDGISASKIIRSELTNYGTIPIIALTASTLLTKKKLALSAGMTDFISKPYSPNQLLKILHQHLNKESNIENQKTTIQEKTTENNEAISLDRAFIESLYGDDIEYQTEMFEIFLEQIDDELKSLTDAFDNQQIDILGKAAHKIKPGMAMVGMTQVKSLMDDLETICKSKDHSNITTAYNKFVKEFNANIKLVHQELANLRS